MPHLMEDHPDWPMTEPSKTPRTDAVMAEVPRYWNNGWMAPVVALCRELETALSEVTQRAERAEQDAAAVRALMNLHNLGGWTDAEAPMKAGRWALALVTDWVDTDRYDMREYVAARATLGFPALNGELPLPEAPK